MDRLALFGERPFHVIASNYGFGEFQGCPQLPARSTEEQTETRVVTN
jgi:hypothetical protein